ncbi:Deacetylase [Rubrobacter radiotolerans]|uniref:Deacetylase n=1 Tax=Rubrobacter radiotolerans TaxID=42256 RepID=A0A023X717_RUBRA|nr:histone deacetylase [Rubrobacter radiotolerans]AHY47825.1 Deacetylase [Rubrobacter radiotolerans]MDX5892464.1 histone deacetylase [Rubrobacter radiotolerans]SMC07755.1 Acetoin utilization deacetylase AcuC [Rubrobacter radiotolerans DSM 5868]
MLLFTSAACEKHANANSSVEVPSRYPAMLAGIESARALGAKVERRAFESATEGELLAVHDRDYLRLLRETSAAGGGHLDADTAVNGRSWEATLAASGAAAAAVEAALDGAASLALVRPPGHHAGPGYAMGFCLTNHAAHAAAHALRLGVRRVAVLDWDVHHGNGTQDVFYARDDVLYLSVHRGGFFYPGTGRVGETGAGAGEGFTANAPLPARSGEAVFTAALEGIFARILREYEPEVIVVSAGFDAHALDPLGGMELPSAAFGRFAAGLAGLAREIGAAPPALITEGGYSPRALTESVAATVVGAESRDGSWSRSGGGPVGGYGSLPRPVEEARRALAVHWPGLRR